ncbi:dopamine-beta-monooxygenase [Schistosoma mansoni]|uniref:dopamine-beta-monooxygenase n=1 Tax=Schistosoma mansoni TaxID=6183 RepID=UPI00022DC9D7|nr:dopamine-beta-monooxygenase [Schistosoma mansoni]|eukprot:XP_018655655.1 dopamine-beta-monooxygenase [Schistosoma mansoni]
MINNLFVLILEEWQLLVVKMVIVLIGNQHVVEKGNEYSGSYVICLEEEEEGTETGNVWWSGNHVGLHDYVVYSNAKISIYEKNAFHSIYDHISRHDVIYQMWLHRIGLTPMISLNNLEMKQIPYKKILLQLIKSSSYTDFKVTEDIKIFSLHVHKSSLNDSSNKVDMLLKTLIDFIYNLENEIVYLPKYDGGVSMHSEVEVPAVETTYWCKTIELPYFSEPHHIVRYENDIQERSQGFIHHMEVFRCPGHNKRYYDAPCNSETKPEDLIDCREVIAAWAMGSTGLTFPEEAGYPIGGLSGKEYAVIEIHYYNPDNISGIIDNSGFRFYITNQLRKYDVGIMELGLVYTPNNFIPFKQSNFFLSGYCDSQCTDITLPKPNGIFVFASQLHTHLTGIKVVTYHIRNGTRLPDLNRDNYYSPHFQEIRQLDQQIQIKPKIGERLLNFVDWSNLGINTIECRPSGLSVKGSGARLVSPGFESPDARSWMRTAEESHNRTKRLSSACGFSMVV